MAITVLVVDDDPDICDFVREALEEAGYQVVTAVNGASLPIARDVHPDVILLDINMPGMDGMAVSQHLRADPRTADIPIVVMSAQRYLQANAAALPVDDRLPKPFDLAQLYRTVAQWAAAS